MDNEVLLIEAAKLSNYTQEHITWLLRKGKVVGRKVGWVWLVNVDSLKAYQARMEKLGTKKHTPSTKESPS